MRVFARAAVLFAASFLLAGCDVLTSYLDSISDGASCTTNEECLGGLCLTDAQGYPEGYCTTPECDGSGCSNIFGAECLSVDGGGPLCFENCSELRPCRTGYECLAVGADQVCLPSGLGDTYSAAGTIGAPCGNGAECASGTCLTNFVDGYCSATGCTSSSECGDGSICVQLSESVTDTACLKSCTAANGCRFGYECFALDAADSVCAPSDAATQSPVRNPNGVADGSPCSADINCKGGTCIRGATSSEFPGGYCTSLDCAELGGDSAGCNAPTGRSTSCRTISGSSACYLSCGQDSDCRAGYDCIGAGTGDGYCGTAGQTSPTAPTAPDTGGGINVVCQSTSISGGRALTFDIAASSVAFAVVPYSQADLVAPSRLLLPNGQVGANFATDHAFMTVNAGILQTVAPVVFPAAPQFQNIVQQGGGRYTLEINTSDDSPCYYVLQKSVEGSKIDMNIYLVGVNGITAANAAQNAGMRTMLDTMRRIYSKEGVTIRTVRYFDVSGTDRERYRIVRNINDCYGLVSLSRAPGPTLAEKLSVNVFLIQGFQVAEAEGLLGLSLGAPGVPGVHGNEGAGLVFTSEYLSSRADMTGQTLAHEVGHFLGLRHTTEHGGTEADPIQDTPVCSNPDRGTSCPDATNFMFPFSLGNTQEGISDGQGFALRRTLLTQ
jgi:hypothetical protein